MSKNPSRSAAVRAYLFKLGNPYAKLQIEDSDPDPDPRLATDPKSDLRPLTRAEREYVRQLGDPYAALSVGLNDSVENSKTVVAAPDDPSDGEMSMTQFDSECRRILRQYSPALERGRLRDQHRAFITRNRVRSPKERYQLARGLRRYDLSGVAGGIQTHFNRERDELTEAKLNEIERTVLGGDK